MTRPTSFILIVLAVVLLLGTVSLNDALLYTPDSARYLIWADALAGGDGFADNTSPEPARYVVHAPLYPILIAPAAFVAPLSVPAAKFLTLLSGLLLLWLVYRWLSRLTNEWMAFAATSFLAIHSLFLVYANQVLSEIPFAIAIILILQQFLAIGSKKDGLAVYAPLVLALGAGLFLREVGLALVGAVLVLFALRKDWRSLLIVGAFCAVLYGLWFVRNELIVAPIEQPPLRNSKLFFTHLFTPEASSLAEEFIARLSNNIVIYAGHLTTFIFAPDFVRNTHGLVDINNPLVSFSMAVVPYLKPLFVVIPLALLGSALYFRWRQDELVRTATLMALLYIGPILFYPINDIRFLFPVFLLSLIVMTLGAHELWVRFGGRIPRHAATGTAFVLGVLLLFPNVSWATSFFWNNVRFAHDRQDFTREIDEDPQMPEYYLKDLPGAGAWIVGHSRPEDAVLCRWKELGLWLEGRPVLDVDPQMTPDSFDRMLRDYAVKYVATIRWRNGIRENETQLEYSSFYDFASVAAFGSIEILEVRPKRRGPSEFRAISSDADSLVLFRTALRILRRGDPAVAESLLVRVEQRMGRWGVVVFHQAVAKALAGHDSAALGLLQRFRTMPQAGSFVQQAWYHQEILDRYRRAEAAVYPDERAQQFHVVGVNYWELGYRAQAFRMIDSALAGQPAFFPALIFGAIFSYQDGDHDKAEDYFARAEAANSSNLLVVQLARVFEADRRLGKARTAADSIAALMEKASGFLTMDMRDDALATWIAITTIDSTHRETLRALARTYAEKRKFGPSRQWARSFVRLYPQDKEMEEFLVDIERRWDVP